MAFADFGIAKGLAVTPDWQGMVTQADKSFALQNEVMQQRKAEVEKKATEMELGQVYDKFNEDRYNVYMKDKYKEIADFDMKNPGYEFNPIKSTERKAIINGIKNNEILRESANTKAEVEKLYKYISEHPGSENQTDVKAQLEELSNTLQKGNHIGGVSQGYHFRMPATKDIRTDIIKDILPAITKSDLKHKDGMLYTESSLDEGALESNVNMYLMNPENMSAIKGYFDALPQEARAAYGGSPVAMFKNLTRSAFVPEESKGTQYRDYGRSSSSGSNGSSSESNSKTPVKPIFNPYKVWVQDKGMATDNPMLKAATISKIDGKGNLVVTNKSGDNTLISYADPDKGMVTYKIPADVYILSGDNFDDTFANEDTDVNSPTYGRVRGVRFVVGKAAWTESGTLETLKAKYPGATIVQSTTKNGACDINLDGARFSAADNEKDFNSKVARLSPKGAPEGSRYEPVAPLPGYEYINDPSLKGTYFKNTQTGEIIDAGGNKLEL